MINVEKFTEEVKSRREEALALVGTSPLIKTYRDALRTICDEGEWQVEEEGAVPARTAEDLRDELFSASIAAYTNGATEKQIDLIVSLCAKTGDFSRMGYTVLTKRKASRLINDLTK